MHQLDINKLTTSDLQEFPVCRFWYEGDAEYVEPTDRVSISETDSETYIVKTEFTTHSGITLAGYCSPQDTSGMDYIQPVVITDLGQVRFWKDSKWTETEMRTELDKLDMEATELFPLRYISQIPCDDQFYVGRILDFGEQISIKP